MTFEEAIEKINDLFFEPCIPGYSTGDFAPEFSGQIEDLEEIMRAWLHPELIEVVDD